MCDIQIKVHCPTSFSEVLPSEPELTELLVEDIIGQALLELFDTVFVENVSISRPPAKGESD